MAVARILCGECGEEISSSDAVCPQCGTEVELPETSRGAGQTACEVCGERNRPGTQICGSCGAKLPGAVGRRVEGRSGRHPKKRTDSKVSGDRVRAGRRFEPWQIVSAVAVLVLAAYFVYSEVSRDLPVGESRPLQGETTPGQMSVDVAALELAVEENPGDPQAMLKLANALQYTRDFPRAIEYYKKYLMVETDNPDARVDLGICYFELARADTIHGGGFYEAAIQEMETVIEQHPHHQHAAFNLGIVHLSFGDLDESIRWFRRAVEVDESSDLGLRAKRLLEQHAMTE
ncbi:MAG: tetratricopeptide repeat protein [Bacteroidota bacterium]